MNGPAHQEPAPAPQPRTAHGVSAPDRSPEPAKPGRTGFDVPHDEHADEPGYGHGV
jgi:hypothetical protein